jgi:DNA-binding NtrC family response regulator
MVTQHLLVAEIQTKRRELRRAEASLNNAATLLEDYPNVVQEGTYALARSAHAALCSDLDEALRGARKALECANKSGAVSLRIPALGTLSHVLLAAGRFDECQASLAAALSRSHRGGSVEIGLHDTQLQLALAMNDLPAASAAAATTAQISERLDDGHSYYGLWYQLTRVRWLLRLGDIPNALRLALDAIPVIERMADRNLLDRIKLLAAEALGLDGRPRDGAQLLAEVMLANEDPPPELVAEFSRVGGSLALADHPAAAREHFRRAARIYADIGNVTARRDVERTAQRSPGDEEGSRPGADDEPAEPPQDAAAPAPSSAAAAARLVEGTAALLDLAPHPALLGREMLALVSETEAALRCVLIEEDGRGARTVLARWPAAGGPTDANPHGHAVLIPLGCLGRRRFALHVTPGPSPSDRATLAALQRLVQIAIALADARQREREQAALWPEASVEQQLGLISCSATMAGLIATTRRVAQSNVTVLITGETGVGKELLARALHQASGRRDRIFLPCNCTAMPRELLDSQLFGYRRGAFTGAHADFPGMIRAAEGGTLFLDEIGELGLDVQPKLLRFLESGEILPLGEAAPRPTDVRIVAATNARLEQLVEAGRFRDDLYYRLNVITLDVPPLRERREEIPLLVQHFLDRFARDAHAPRPRIAEETMEYLVLYGWPGNVRQLANEVRRLVAIAEPGSLVTPALLSRDLAASRRTIAAAPAAPPPGTVAIRLDQPLASATEQLERALITHVLAETGRNVERAAEILGVSRKGLFLKRRRYQID